MKTLIILISLLFISCATMPNYKSDIKIIKFEKFGVIKYDWFSSFKVVGNHCIYFKDTIGDNSTNYIYGDFEIISYIEYRKIKD